MANLENNNSENNKPISEKVGEKITDVAEGVKAGSFAFLLGIVGKLMV